MKAVIGLGAAGLLAGGAWLWLRRHLLVVTVQGPSMEPTLRSGERLLARRRGVREVPRRGAIVVVDLPPTRVEPPRPHGAEDGTEPAGGAAEVRGRVIKRVRGFTPTDDGLALQLVGDNPDASLDSRHFGPVPLRYCLGTVLRRMRENYPVPRGDGSAGGRVDRAAARPHPQG